MTDKTFTVACLGASAGGLDACKCIIGGVPADAGLALVVINHLRFHAQPLLPAILAKETSMPVQLIADGMLLERNHVYVISEKCDLTLRKGNFRPSALSKRQGWAKRTFDFHGIFGGKWEGTRSRRHSVGHGLGRG